jgi:hypothetical protein
MKVEQVCEQVLANRAHFAMACLISILDEHMEAPSPIAERLRGRE